MNLSLDLCKIVESQILKNMGLLTCSCVAQAANDADLEPVAYEFFTQAYILYEEEISVGFAHFIITLS